METGFDVQWCVDVALQRTTASASRRIVRDLKRFLVDFHDTKELTPERRSRIRTNIDEAVKLSPETIPPDVMQDLVRSICNWTVELMKQRIKPRGNHDSFRVWGREDSDGINWTLRKDLEQMGRDAEKLISIAAHDERHQKWAENSLRANRTLIDQYEQFILRNWPLSDGTSRSLVTLKAKLNGH